MAGLGSNKKRSSSSAQNKRVSRFSEVLGAAQSNAQISGYSDGQPPTQQNTQQHQNESAVGYSDGQPPTQQNTQQPESNQGSQSSNQETQVTGYPDSQPPTQQNTQKTKSSKKVDGQPKTRKPKQPQSQQSNHEVAGYPDSQPPMQQEYDVSSKNKIPGYPNMQTLAQPTTQQNSSQSKKLAKRENPDYTQTTFRIPKKLSRKIDRAIMDLADSDVEIDRSDLLEELAGAFVRLSENIGVVKALEQFKNLGIR